MSVEFNPELKLECLCAGGMPGCEHEAGKCDRETKLKYARSPYFCNGCTGRRAKIINGLVDRNLRGEDPFPDRIPDEWLRKDA